MASMEDVTGFNQKTHVNDGEKLIEKAVKEISKRYGTTLCEILKCMLKFNENERPNFVELAKQFLENPLCSNPKEIPKLKKRSDDIQSQDNAEEANEIDGDEKENNVAEEHKEPQPAKKLDNKLEGGQAAKSLDNKKAIESLPEKKEEESKRSGTNEQSSGQLMTQAELFKAYLKSNELHVNLTDVVYWFEFGGNSIGHYEVSQTVSSMNSQNQLADTSSSNKSRKQEVIKLTGSSTRPSRNIKIKTAASANRKEIPEKKVKISRNPIKYINKKFDLYAQKIAVNKININMISPVQKYHKSTKK
jgi:hypothetical protein